MNIHSLRLNWWAVNPKIAARARRSGRWPTRSWLRSPGPGTCFVCRARGARPHF